jgi:tRNA-Thr(GGU) m(6)t(6)A37 methyltransferase TsaA
MIDLTEIGRVQSRFKQREDPFVMRKQESQIIIKQAYTDGLFRLVESKYIQIIFGFHLSHGYSLKGPVYTGQIKGVFASRSPRRPSPLGVTTVKLLQINNNKLIVSGLDAVNGSPVYDIKPHAPVFNEAETVKVEKQWLYNNPRRKMIRLVKGKDLQACLLAAGGIHGHFCPGLAAGVYAAVTGLNKLSTTVDDGMENMLAITETNNCFADGIQVVTGCTLGNNSLIYHDLGKTAVTLALRATQKGIRIRMKADFYIILTQRYGHYSALFDKVIKQRVGSADEMLEFELKSREVAFGLLGIPFENLFTWQEVDVVIPAYAPIFNNLVCSQCGENVPRPASPA